MRLLRTTRPGPDDDAILLTALRMLKKKKGLATAPMTLSELGSYLYGRPFRLIRGPFGAALLSTLLHNEPGEDSYEPASLFADYAA